MSNFVARVIPPLTFTSSLDANKSIQTALVDVSNLSLFTLNYKCAVASKVEVFQHHSASNTTSDTTNFLLVYSETVAANTVFYKRLTIKGNFAMLKITNTTATRGGCKMTTCGLTIPNFEAQTFLNSTIDINANASLSRIANDFTLDLIRNIHQDFSKINVLGITDKHQQETIGLDGMSYFPPSAETFYVVSTSNDDGIGGVGARDVIMEYIDENGVEQTYTIILQGTSQLTLAITGLAVNSLKVSNAGGQAANQGTISVYTNNNIANLLCRILPEQNVSRVARYRVPANKHLVVNDINISGYSVETKLEIIERAAGIDYIIGTFGINTANQQLVYRLDTKVNSGSTLYVRQTPISTGGASTLINLNINGMLCPDVNNF